MRTNPIITSMQNGSIDTFPTARQTIVELVGTGTCKIRTLRKYGNTTVLGKSYTLATEDPILFPFPLDAIEILDATGEATIYLEGTI